MVEIHSLIQKGSADKIGTVTTKETEYGTLFTPKSSGLIKELHGGTFMSNIAADPARKM